MDQLVDTHSKFGSNGKHVLRSMQDNNEIPLVDLFVREAIQNSLDAGAGKTTKDYIDVNFILGKFDRAKLNKELSGSTELLNKDFPEKQYEFIAVRDCNTVGLNGKIEDSEYKEGEPFGNFKKLVYEIGEPQETDGSGGSWGLGKTVYFRIGIGIVLYYTRFRDEKGKSVSRLAATIVEDKNDIRYQPKLDNKLRSGISWWGKNKTEEDTIPITDTGKISEILSYFNIEPFSVLETGTIIIIPYIDRDKLINSNLFTYEDLDGKTKIPYWDNTLEDSLKMAIQRWYFPRINNVDYKYGQYLKVAVGSEYIEPKKFAPLFRVLWEMYKVASAGCKLHDDSFCTLNAILPKETSIEVKKYFQGNDEIGSFVYAKVKGILDSGQSLFQIKPYYYINNNPDTSSRNRPIIPFVRKPGLIINYNVDASWINKEFDVTDDEYIIGIFVLRSSNRLKEEYGENLTLEEYIRSGEKAQHTEWIDQTKNQKQLKIVYYIKKRIKEELVENFNITKNSTLALTQSSFSHKFGVILPPLNFGHGSAFAGGKTGTKTKTGGNVRKKTEKSELVLDYDNIKYSKDGLTLKGNLYVGKKPGIVNISLNVDSEGKVSSLEEWLDEDRLEAPFEFFKVTASEEIRCDYKKSNDKKVYAFEFDARELTSETVSISIELRVYKQDFVPGIVFKEYPGEEE